MTNLKCVKQDHWLSLDTHLLLACLREVAGGSQGLGIWLRGVVIAIFLLVASRCKSKCEIVHEQLIGLAMRKFDMKPHK